jgi:uncharacterized protein
MVALLMGVLLATGAQAASFDCGRAATADEYAICANRGLNDADVRVAVKYEVVSRTLAMGGRAALRDDQRAFLAKRRQCGASVACISSLYAAQETKLQKGLDHIYGAGPF